MLLDFEKKLADFIKANGLFGSTEKIVLAVSGGADSMALIYATRALKNKGLINAELLCAHINHQLRGTEGDLDQEFVAARAEKLKLAVKTKRIDVRGFARLNKLSIETAGRKLRIQALMDIAKANDSSLIATAHQKNDNAETIIQRLSRGTGFRGLAGIWPERVFADEIKFVRPMLCFTRNEILKYLQRRNLNWRRDHTNADCTYRRNYIRHRLIPMLQRDCSESMVEQLSQLAQSARGYYRIVCKRANELWPDMADCGGDKTVLDLKLSEGEPQPVKIELIRKSLASINCGERYITQQHYEGILQLAEHNVTGKEIVLSGGFTVRREYRNLIFTSCRVGLAPPISSGSETAIEIPGQTTFKSFLIKAAFFEKNEVDFEKFKAAKTDSVEWFDLDKTKPPFIVRQRRPGDKFIPLGQSKAKKIGKFLTAQRIPHGIRSNVLVIADKEKIIWILPVRVSEQTKITDETRKILQLQITALDSYQHFT